MISCQWKKIIVSVITISVTAACNAIESEHGNEIVKSKKTCYTDCLNVAPKCYENGHVFVDGRFLYWQASIDDLNAFVEQKATIFNLDSGDATIPKPVFSEARIRDFKGGWGPGVQASIGYSSCNCGWEVYLTGTYFEHETAHSYKFPRQQTLTEDGVLHIQYEALLLNPSSSGHGADSTTTRWKLDFRTLDLLMAGKFNPWRNLSLKPNFGLRGAWIDQHYGVKYKNCFWYGPNDILQTEHVKNSEHTRYTALGFKAGCDFAVRVVKHLKVIGGLGGSLLYGKSTLHDKIHGFYEEVFSVGDTMDAKLNPFSGKFRFNKRRLRGNVESELGIAADVCWKPCSLEVSCSYLFDLWFDQYDFINDLYSVGPGTAPNVNSFPLFVNSDANLQIQGFVLSARLAF